MIVCTKRYSLFEKKQEQYLFTDGQFYRFNTSLALNIATPVELTLAPLLDSENKQFNKKNQVNEEFYFVLILLYPRPQHIKSHPSGPLLSILHTRPVVPAKFIFRMLLPSKHVADTFLSSVCRPLPPADSKYHLVK